jgi:hypothetical protein
MFNPTDLLSLPDYEEIGKITHTLSLSLTTPLLVDRRGKKQKIEKAQAPISAQKKKREYHFGPKRRI